MWRHSNRYIGENYSTEAIMSPVGISTLLSPLIQKVPLYKIQRMKIAVDVNALMFTMSKCAIRHRVQKKFSLKEANNVLKHEAYEMAECEAYCIDTIKGTMDVLKEEFYCVFVFDGKVFPEKQLETERRLRRCLGANETLTTMRRIFQRDPSDEKNARQYYNALFECIELSISEAPTSLDICVVGEYEADVTCAHMCQSGEVDAVLSSDYDSLLFGCPYLIKDIDLLGGYADVITLQDIYSHFNIDHSQAIDICILMGTNYNKKINKVGPKTALAEIRSHGKLENTKYYNEKQLNVDRLRNIYNCAYSRQKVRRFSLEAHEPLSMLETMIKVL